MFQTDPGNHWVVIAWWFAELTDVFINHKSSRRINEAMISQFNLINQKVGFYHVWPFLAKIILKENNFKIDMGRAL